MKKTVKEKLLTETYDKLMAELNKDILIKFEQSSPELYAEYLKSSIKDKITIFNDLKSRYLMPNNIPYTKGYDSAFIHYKAGNLTSLNNLIQKVTIDGATSYLINEIKTYVGEHAPELVSRLSVIDNFDIPSLESIYLKLVIIENYDIDSESDLVNEDLIEQLIESLEPMPK